MTMIGRDSIVTVIGGSGFIGRYVVEKLAHHGCLIRVAVRRPDRALFLKTAGDVGQITPIPVNIRDQESIDVAVAGSQAVINLVGILYQAGAQRFATVQVASPARPRRPGRRISCICRRSARIRQVRPPMRAARLPARPRSAKPFRKRRSCGQVLCLVQKMISSIALPPWR